METVEDGGDEVEATADGESEGGAFGVAGACAGAGAVAGHGEVWSCGVVGRKRRRRGRKRKRRVAYSPCCSVAWGWILYKRVVRAVR